LENAVPSKRNAGECSLESMKRGHFAGGARRTVSAQKGKSFFGLASAYEELRRNLYGLIGAP
jgi:hypothetical protein